MKISITTAVACGMLIIAALSVTGCATNAATGEKNLMLVSEDDESKLGREEHESLVQSKSLYSNQKLQDYLLLFRDWTLNASATQDGVTSQHTYLGVLFHEKYTILVTGTNKDPAWLATHRYVFDAQTNSARILTQSEYDQIRVKRIKVVKPMRVTHIRRWLRQVH